ncbi:MAG: hypothetical protein JW727_04460 [Candidatus Aenigmarchaeota archaeon]|nr:hypothetical protein [Candidatus Aenigmarchaeota archaeon]
MVTFTEHLRRSFGAYIRNFRVIALALIIAAIPSAMLVGLGFYAVSDFSFGEAGRLAKETYFADRVSIWEDSPYPPELFSPWFFVFEGLAAIVTSYMLAGTYGVCLSAIKGRPSLSDFFRSLRESGVTLVLSKIALLAGLTVSLVLLFLTGLVFAAVANAIFSVSEGLLGMLFVLFFILIIAPILPLVLLVSPSVVSGRSVVEAFRESYALGIKHYWGIVGLILVAMVLMVVSGILGVLNALAALLFSGFFVSPLIALLLSSYYLDKSGKKQARGSEMTPRNAAKKKVTQSRRK